jgi:hypothetical protein
MGITQVVQNARKHLTDIDIAKILGLGKGSFSHRKIADLRKCGKWAVQHAVATDVFETFEGRNKRRDYKRKTTQREDRYIERTFKQTVSVHFAISQILSTHQFQMEQYGDDAMKQVWEVILRHRSLV